MKAHNCVGWAGLAVTLLATGIAYSAELITSHVEQPPDLLAQPESNVGLFRLAMFDFIPQISVGMTHDDNIFATATNLVADFIWTVAPGITAVASDLESGKMMSLSYTPSFVFYTENTSENNIGQSVALSAKLPLARLTLGLAGALTMQQSAVVGTGQLVQTRTYTGAPTAKYELGARTSVEVNAKVSLQEGQGLVGNTTWGNNDWINYNSSEKLSLGLGVTFNYTTIQDSPDQTYEQALVRTVYTISEKVVLTATAGPEWRQYSGQAPSTLNPSVAIGCSYKVREGTTVNFDAVGRIQASVDVTGQDYYATSFRLYVVQGLTDKLSLTASGGYEHDRYYAVVTGVTADQPNDLFTVGGSLNYQIRKKWTAGIFYNYRRQSGNATLNEFTDNQAGIQTSWRY